MIFWLLLLAAPLLAQEFTDAQALLKRRCQGCHGAALQTSGLRLDRRDAMLAGGYSGPAIVPGKSEESRLVQIVRDGVGGRFMPPAGPRLTGDEIATLQKWIDAGAPWVAESGPLPAQAARRASSHWSFQPIQDPRPPKVTQPEWVRQPIDSFILAKLEAEKIAPSSEASRETLLRRMSFDLVGLPPTSEEVRAFLSDGDPKAHEHAVDRLLASPHFGEKWARHWLDLARYSDSDGYQKDEFRPNAFRYRDWVVEALNRNLPFDQFTIEQIAGDLLPNATVAQKTATGFHRMTLTSREAGIDLKQLRAEQVEDRANTVSAVWLGLTVGCAACHDHKFDPLSQKEHYQLSAFFNSSREETLEAPLPEEARSYQDNYATWTRERDELLSSYGILELQPEFERQMRAAAQPGAASEWVANFELLPVLVDGGDVMLAKEPAQRTDWENYQLRRFLVRTYARVVGPEVVKRYRLSELKHKLDALDEKYPRFSEPMVLIEMSAPPKTFIHLRGDFRNPGIEVQPGTPAVLPPLLAGPGRPDRLALARWLVSDENPLTARVAVNRIWQELFGRGLVATSEDFGSRGDRPTHPELLDWLAYHFRTNGWNVKELIRTIVLSSAYRQSSQRRKDLEVKDPANLLLARQSRFRLPAELVRDEALSVAGLLDGRVGGRSVRPPLAPGVLDFAFNEEEFIHWTPSQGLDRYRRGLYTVMHRSVPYPQNITFDAPDGLVSCSRRNRSTTALQALTLLNDPVFVEAANALAKRVTSAKADDASRIEYAFQLTLSRPPLPEEKTRLLEYLHSPHETDAWAGAASILLNLDEFLSRE